MSYVQCCAFVLCQCWYMGSLGSIDDVVVPEVEMLPCVDVLLFVEEAVVVPDSVVVDVVVALLTSLDVVAISVVVSVVLADVDVASTSVSVVCVLFGPLQYASNIASGNTIKSFFIDLLFLCVASISMPCHNAMLLIFFTCLQ